MRIGISTVPRGRLADPAATRAMARAAEQLGYSSVWVRDPTPGRVDDTGGRLDPLAVVTAVATITTRVQLGAHLRLGPRWLPEELAASLRSLGVRSEGRFTAGVETSAVALLDQALDMLDTIGPRPPVLVGVDDPAVSHDLVRVVRRAGGWLASGVHAVDLAPRWERVRARSTGSRLRLVVPVKVDLRDHPVTGPRSSYQGDLDQVATDLDTTRRAGADEVILGVPGDPGLDQALDVYARVAERMDVS